LTGYSIDELMKMNFWDLIHPDLKDVVKERGKARLRGENVPNRYEAKIITKSGEEKWIDLTVTSFELEGKPAVLGNALDITERKNAHEELLKSEDKFRKLAENAPIAVTRLLIKDSSYEFVNEEFIRQSDKYDTSFR
jgi:PAS domain S-box-containing protein